MSETDYQFQLEEISNSSADATAKIITAVEKKHVQNKVKPKLLQNEGEDGNDADEEKPEEKPAEEDKPNEEDDEEKIETPQLDPRFPNQNQTSHCWSAYIDYHRAVELLGEEHEAASYFKKTYTSMCPNRWVERWDEQRENGTFPAIIHRVKLVKDDDEEKGDDKKPGEPDEPGEGDDESTKAEEETPPADAGGDAPETPPDAETQPEQKKKWLW